MTQLNTTDQELVRILAAVDTVHWPDRLTKKGSGDGYVVRAERRDAYPESGVPVATAGATADERKAAERSRSGLESDGLILVPRRGGRGAGFQLAEAGDWHARALVGLPQLPEALPLIGRINELADAPDACDFVGKTWVCETMLFAVGWDYGGRKTMAEMVSFLETILPLLVRGYIVAQCDTVGRAWFSIGRAVEPLEVPGDLPPASKAAREFYVQSLDAEFAATESAKRQHVGNIGPIPLPAGGCRGTRRRRGRKR